MFNDRISDYFEGVAAKYLSAVDADPSRSNQHEIGGLPSVGFKQYLGTPSKNEEYRFKAKQVYFTDESTNPELIEAEVTWYDCRRKQPHRKAEYRLYYTRTFVSELIGEGDFFLIAKMRDGSLLMIFTPAGSTIENQLNVLFGLDKINESFSAGSVERFQLHLPLRLMLEELGVETNVSRNEENYWQEKLISVFGEKNFPSTSSFSSYSRDSIEHKVDAFANPDQAIVDWMEHEEKLFRVYERILVQKRLQNGFGEKGEDVDSFISFSLSVQNRRKSRVGHAFEKHLKEIFKIHSLKFDQGAGKGFTTENNAKPDFMFPSFSSYRNQSFPLERLYMLGAKTTCKDRWRQVLSEAARLETKHLVTLEAAISVKQTLEMQSSKLQLVVPVSIHETYSPSQCSWLMSLADFIAAVKKSQCF